MRRALLLSVALLASPPALAQTPLCQPAESVTQCINNRRTEAETANRTGVKDAAKADQRLAAKKTETSLDSISGLSSSVKDFLPLLQLGGVLGAVQSDDQTGLVTVALNTPFMGSSGGAKKDNALQVKAVIDTTARLFGPLEKQLPEKDRANAAKQLVTAKTDAENVTLHASYNVSSRRFGRNFNQHQDTLDALFDEALRSVASARSAFNGRLIALSNAHQDIRFDQPMSTLSVAQRQLIEVGIVEVLDLEQKLDAALATAIRQSGLDVYGQLVTNQPQLQVSFSKSFRDDLFGPDLVTGRVSYEMGIGNTLNAALGSFNGSCAASPAACLKTYSTFAGAPATRAAIKAGNRLSVYAEFVTNTAYSFTRADPALNLTIPKGTGWTAGVDYGRLIAVDDGGTAAGRVDGSIRWESPADDTVDTRFVASVTITKKLGDISVPFGIVYANKEKFLVQSGVDKGLTANIGLKFNLFSGLN